MIQFIINFFRALLELPMLRNRVEFLEQQRSQYCYVAWHDNQGRWDIFDSALVSHMTDSAGKLIPFWCGFVLLVIDGGEAKYLGRCYAAFSCPKKAQEWLEVKGVGASSS